MVKLAARHNQTNYTLPPRDRAREPRVEPAARADLVSLHQRIIAPTQIRIDATPGQAIVSGGSLLARNREAERIYDAGGNLRSHEEQAASLTSESHYKYIMDINLTATIHCCQAASAPMQKAGSGKIVNVASQAGLWSGRDGGGMPYKVAKAGIIHYTRCLAGELGPHNVHVNCIAPGLILSSRAVAQGRNSEASRQKLEPQIPLRRLGTPEDCAKVVEFLVSDLSDYVTGQCIPVCGGFVAF